MEEILQGFRVSQKKVSTLEQSILHLQTQKRTLANELDLLKRELAEKEQQITLLKEKYEAAKLAKEINSSSDHTELIAKIDKYLKEIDICLRYFGVQD